MTQEKLTSPDLLLQTTGSNKKATTMFEVSDAGRDGEYGRGSGNLYNSLFKGFIESLGYAIENKSYFGSVIEINGVEFNIDTENASYKTRSHWSREIRIRKLENRFIVFSNGLDKSKFKLRIHFNKEYEIQKLKNKIDAAIKEMVDRRKYFENISNLRVKNVTEIAMHYLKDEKIKTNVEYINIHQGVISFYIKETGSVEVNTDNTFKQSTLHNMEMKTANEIVEFIKNGAYKIATLATVTEAVLEAGSISAELVEWAKDQYHGYFYTKTMSVER